jgi:hypothetical protein
VSHQPRAAQESRSWSRVPAGLTGAVGGVSLRAKTHEETP